MIKKEGFDGERTFVIPDHIIELIKEEPHNGQLYITDIGFYPKASNHYRCRQQGCSQYILIYCTEGGGWVSVDGIKVTLTANQYYIIPPRKAHSYAANNDNPWTIYWIHYNGRIAHHFSNNSRSAQNILPSSYDRIKDRLRLFSEIFANIEMGFSPDNINYANICLWYLLGSFRYLSQFRQISNEESTNMIDRSIIYMRQHLGDKLTLDKLAKNVGLSASHYSYAFKKNTGKPPLDYFIHLRIQQACHLLDHSDLQIKEIALKVGYEDAFYFSRIFKKVMNMSPKAYKTELKG
ncbi:AraC family transcriptional regulator [Carboxylicivirga mesophila]|uniref:AraC family transcriptional regulator n=1 Tax=Carboxylicivirga mesophila TaxID=1166478 RepID=A0ABS5K6Z6_9BACT|nr:AraC family transcriptional regulator [Carboxylicivirga mesophila]MBS2210697.1 AraC family transcriptional regulator [Carboxylicivirga mesophila]